jgi:hypothetical protein
MGLRGEAGRGRNSITDFAHLMMLSGNTPLLQQTKEESTLTLTEEGRPLRTVRVLSLHITNERGQVLVQQYLVHSPFVHGRFVASKSRYVP